MIIELLEMFVKKPPQEVQISRLLGEGFKKSLQKLNAREFFRGGFKKFPKKYIKGWHFSNPPPNFMRIQLLEVVVIKPPQKVEFK